MVYLFRIWSLVDSRDDFQEEGENVTRRSLRPFVVTSGLVLFGSCFSLFPVLLSLLTTTALRGSKEILLHHRYYWYFGVGLWIESLER